MLVHNIKFLLFLILVFISLVYHLYAKPLKIHVIPHTHDDVGWLQTFDDLYYKDQKCVKCILDNMLISLADNPKRTFTYVEMAFFKRWYDEITDKQKLQVKEFIKNGQLEFANGVTILIMAIKVINFLTFN